VRSTLHRPGGKESALLDEASSHRAAPSRGGPRRDSAASASPLRGVRSVLLMAGVLMTVGALYFSREFLVPVAVAGLLTFVLSPIVRVLERALPRPAAVVLVVVLAFAILGAFAWALALQAADLGSEIPTYRDHLKHKIAEIRGASRGSVIEKVQTATKEVVDELQKEDKSAKPAEKPVPVVVKPSSSTVWSLPAVVSAVGNVGLVLVLVIFMLLERLQLRDRLIGLIGFGRIATTTKAMDEAAQRITQYLTRQTLVNGTFGLGVTVGALLIGLPYAFLWGSLAAILRFIPYVGPWIAAVLVSLAGLAVFDGWIQPVLIASMFIALELITGFGLEPYLYSQSAGVSQVGLLVAVAFWTWIWGPIGLALATPLTVCLVVLAKYVPDLEIVSVLMSDEPVMSTARRYYQRLVARDENEASALAQEYAHAHPGYGLYDEVFVPALNQAQRDHLRGRITDADVGFVERTTRQLVEELDLPQSTGEPASRPPLPILGLPAREEGDEIVLMMLRQELDPGRFTLDVASPDLLVSEAIAAVEAEPPAAVMISALAGGAGHALHIRYLCKRLRTKFPDLPIVVGWFGVEGGDAAARDEMEAAGASRVAGSLVEACAHLQELAPLQRLPGPSAAAAVPLMR
jgi:predicted PurR-regulated permease PerM